MPRVGWQTDGLDALRGWCHDLGTRGSAGRCSGDTSSCGVSGAGAFRSEQRPYIHIHVLPDLIAVVDAVNMHPLWRCKPLMDVQVHCWQHCALLGLQLLVPRKQ